MTRFFAFLVFVSVSFSVLGQTTNKPIIDFSENKIVLRDYRHGTLCVGFT